MIAAALEARAKTDGIQRAPHFILKGIGETRNILFTTKDASTLITDFEGAGQLTLKLSHKALKVDHRGQTTLTRKPLVDTLKTFYQNNWSVKEHGCHQDNNATCIWIATNAQALLTLIAFDEDLGPLQHRFIKIECGNKKLLYFLGERAKLLKRW